MTPPRPLPTFSKYLAELNTAQGKDAEAQILAFRQLIIAFIQSGFLDNTIKREINTMFREQVEIHTHSSENDAERWQRRLRMLKNGLALVLRRDLALDDALLNKHGITRSDKSGQDRKELLVNMDEDDTATSVAKRDVNAAKNQELLAKRKVLTTKQAELVAQTRKLNCDISKGNTR